MADNIVLNAGSGGDTIASDEIGGVKYQRVKLVEGADGVNDGDISVANPLPVAQTGALPAGTNNIGDVDVLSLPALAAGTNNIGDVDVLTVPADPFGANADAAATAGSTGSIQAKLRLMTSQLDSIKTAVEVIDNSIAGSETQVDVVTLPAIPAGTNNIGDVDVLSVIPGTGATNLGKAVDSVAGATDTGIVPLAIRDDALSALGEAEGDYVPLRVSSTGALHVTGGGGTEYTEDVAAAADPVGAALIMVRDDALSGQTTTDGDNVAARGTDKGELYVKHVDAIPVTDNAGSLTVDGSVSLAAALPAGTNNIGDVDVLSLPALPAGNNNIGDVDVATIAAGDNNIGNVDIVTVPAPLSTTGGGTEATALRVTVASDSTGVLSVDDNGASLTVDGTVTASNAAGDTAHDAADSGNPIKTGSKAANALPAAVANNDRANNISDLFGRLLTAHIDPAMQFHLNKTFTSQQTGSTLLDPTSGKKIAITSVIIGTYGTTAGRVIVWFGDNGDTTFTQDTDQVLVAASFAPSATGKPGLIFTPSVPVFCNTADRELHITTDAAISLDITIEGYEF
jgi:hypothetical protein